MNLVFCLRVGDPLQNERGNSSGFTLGTQGTGDVHQCSHRNLVFKSERLLYPTLWRIAVPGHTENVPSVPDFRCGVRLDKRK